jgi:transcriptional regulator with XRE-family HTH domain
MASVSKRGVTAEQLRQLSKELNLTVAAIADGTGLSKAYVSEFRNETRNLSASQQAQLRSFLEQKCDEAGMDFPDDEAGDVVGEQLVKGLGGMIQRVSRPAILLSDDVPKDQVNKLLTLIDANRAEVSRLLAGTFQTEEAGLFDSTEVFTEETEQAIRRVFALLALNYLAILMLQGRSPVSQPVTAGMPRTMGDWLSSYLAQSPLAELLPAAEKPAEQPESAPEGSAA